MAITNLLAATTVNARSFQALLTNTTTTALVTNSAASGKSYHVKSIAVANIDGTTSATLTLGIVKSGGSLLKLAHVVPVAAGSTLTFEGVCPTYLEEGDVIQGGASAINSLHITINYLDLS